MRAGRFPGQEDAIRMRVAMLQENAKAMANRRMFLGLAVGGVFGACAGGGAVQALSGGGARSAGPIDPRFETLRKFATGPLHELLSRSPDFIVEVGQAMPDDETVWLGIARIASAVVEKDARVPRGVMRMLLVLADKPGVPGHIDRWIDLVRTQAR